ncbi:isoaspartyl peptidase/L-asparaginase [Massilia sp. Root335]|uniref:isoaspartyl peptidase/L-asparaginase n=1 Tax=Massilia sp. Root335 TaxID=1736517 RepID=UPI0007012AA2|nr:isoaspartyl peptidase/L-asparaginase [Massilia sp. Root335]KQV36753.1 L-asparaginase [Massilia sp. Root335]
MSVTQGYAIVVHGGAGSPRAYADGCARAAQLAVEELTISADALDAAIAAVASMEDDGRFNAGSGSVLCLDGATVEMDASIMDTRGRLGAVACVQGVKNPVLLARAVAETPHWLLAGDGANRFAAAIGHPAHTTISERQRAAHAKVVRELAGRVPAMPGLSPEAKAFLRFWNYQTPLDLPAHAACDTVGAVVRGPDGHFAVALSTGGSAPSLLGRVGDTPIIGSGFYAGPAGAVAATGIGEQIVRHLLARTVYGWIEDGMPLDQALRRGVDLFDPKVPVGLIAASRTDAGSHSNQDMPSARIVAP